VLLCNSLHTNTSAEKTSQLGYVPLCIVAVGINITIHSSEKI